MQLGAHGQVTGFLRQNRYQALPDLAPPDATQTPDGMSGRAYRAVVQHILLLYTLGFVADHDPAQVEVLVTECQTRAAGRPSKGSVECIAHALTGLRSAAIRDRRLLEKVESRLAAPDFLDKLKRLDDWLQRRGENPRLVDYAKAAVPELKERARSYGVV